MSAINKTIIVTITVIIHGITRKTVSKERINNDIKIPICIFEKLYLFSCEPELISPFPVAKQERVTRKSESKA